MMDWWPEDGPCVTCDRIAVYWYEKNKLMLVECKSDDCESA